jgi:glycosyltransferase involved in cell wall biosynthesis
MIWNIMLAFFGNRPLQVGYFYNRKAARKVRKLIREYKPDHIYCQLVRTAEYVKKEPLKKTIDYQDVFSYGVKRRISRSSLLMRPFLRLEYKRLLKYEYQVFDEFNNKTIISIPDRDLIPHPDKVEIAVIPNGVDHDFFKPRKSEKKYDLVFTGNMAYPPNVDAAGFLVNEIMPFVWEKRPETKVMVAGASPDRKVLALKGKNVTVTGWLDDIRDAYASARIFIAPMRIGTGLQNKLLEAMSMRIPSITTPLADDALQARDGEEILIGISAKELAGHILSLLEDNRLNEKIADNGHRFVMENYSWSEATAKLNRIMQET